MSIVNWQGPFQSIFGKRPAKEILFTILSNSIKANTELELTLHNIYVELAKAKLEFDANTILSDDDLRFIDQFKSKIQSINKFFQQGMLQKTARIKYYRIFIQNLQKLANHPILQKLRDGFLRQIVVTEFLNLLNKLANNEVLSHRIQIGEIMRKIYASPEVVRLFENVFFNLINNQQIQKFLPLNKFVQLFIVTPDYISAPKFPSEVQNILYQYFKKKLKNFGQILNYIQCIYDQYKPKGMLQKDKKKISSISNLENIICNVLKKISFSSQNHKVKYIDFKSIGRQSLWIRIKNLHPELIIFKQLTLIFQKFIKQSPKQGSYLYKSFNENKQYYNNNIGFQQEFEEIFKNGLIPCQENYKLWLQIVFSMNIQNNQKQYFYEIYPIYFDNLNKAQSTELISFYSSFIDTLKSKKYTIKMMKDIQKNLLSIINASVLSNYQDKLQIIWDIIKNERQSIKEKRSFLKQLLQIYSKLLQNINQLNLKDNQLKQFSYKLNLANNTVTKINNALEGNYVPSFNQQHQSIINKRDQIQIQLIEIQIQIQKFKNIQNHTLGILTFLQTTYFKKLIKEKGYHFFLNLELFEEQTKKCLILFSKKQLPISTFNNLFYSANNKYLQIYLNKMKFQNIINQRLKQIILVFNLVKPEYNYSFKQNKIFQHILCFQTGIFKKNIRDKNKAQLQQFQEKYQLIIQSLSLKDKLEVKYDFQDIQNLSKIFQNYRRVLTQQQCNILKSDITFSRAKIYFQYSKLFQLAFQITEQEKICLEDYVTEEADSDIQTLHQFIHIIKQCLVIKLAKNRFDSLLQGKVNDDSCFECSKSINQLKQKLNKSKNVTLDFKENTKKIILNSKFYLKLKNYSDWGIICDFTPNKSDSQMRQQERNFTIKQDKQKQKEKQKYVVDMFTMKHYRDKLSVFIQIKQNKEEKQSSDNSRQQDQIAFKLNKQEKEKLQIFTKIFVQVQEIQFYVKQLIKNGYFPYFIAKFLKNSRKQKPQSKFDKKYANKIQQNSIQIFKNQICCYEKSNETLVSKIFNENIYLFEFNPHIDNLLEFIKIKKRQFKILNSDWYDSLRQLWSTYYTACLCNGKLMNKIIQKIFRQQQIIELNSIIQQNLVFQMSNKDFYNQKLQVIYESIFEKTEKKWKNKCLENCIQKQNNQMIKCFSIEQQKKLNKNKTNYYIYHEKDQFWYHIIISLNKRVKINDILFCKQSTNTKDIQRFIASISKSNSDFFFILSTSELKLQVKTYLLQQILNKDEEQDKQQKSLYNSNVCFIDNNRQHKIYQVLYFSSRIRKQIIKHDINNKIDLQKYTNNIKIYHSSVPCCGKTFNILKDIKQKKLIPQYILLSGQVTQQNTYDLLKELNNSQANALVIQISFITNTKIVNKILSQIIFFRTIEQNLYSIQKQKLIYIELQNLQRQSLLESIPILKFLYKSCPQVFIKVQQFNLKNIIVDQNDQQSLLVYKTLQLIDNDQIAYDVVERAELEKDQRYFMRDQVVKIQYKPDSNIVEKIYLVQNHNKIPSNYQDLIQKYLFQTMNGKVSAFLYQYFIKKLYQNFISFYKSPFLDAISFYQARINIKFRKQLLLCLIDNTIAYLKQYFETGQVQRKNSQLLESFRQKIKSFPLIIYALQEGGYIFPFKDINSVPGKLKDYLKLQTSLLSQKQYKNIKVFQTITEPIEIVTEANDGFGGRNKKLESCQRIIQKTVEVELTFEQKYTVTNENIKLIEDYLKKVFQLSYNYKFSPEYKLTDDNFFKILVLAYRFSCKIPTNIMGLSGVGKTRLIKQMSIYQNKIEITEINNIYNNQIMQRNRQRLQNKNNQNFKSIQFISLYLHSGIKKNQLDLFFKKHQIFDSSTKKWILLDQFNTTQQIGIIKNLIQDRIYRGKKISDNIFFITACNPYKKNISFQRCEEVIGLRFKKNIKERQSLQFHVYSYPQSMGKYTIDFQQIYPQEVQKYSKAIFEEAKIKNSLNLSQIAKKLHQQFYKYLTQSSVSLRDIQRLSRLYKWFETKRYILKLSEQQINIVSLCTCYLSKVYSKQLKIKFLNIISSSLKLQNSKVKHQFQKTQQMFLNHMIGLQIQNIAKNKPLIQNVFYLIIAIMTKLPVLIIGAPGSSKSLSISLVQSNLKGKRSKSQFFRNFPEVKIKRYQASQTSTSNALKKIYQQIQELVKNNIQDCVYALIIDQIGLAQYSPDNPLKVLHQFTELTNNKYTTIGISNWALDQSKMSRFLVCQRNMPCNQQLTQTTIQIMKNYLKDQLLIKYQMESMAKTLAVIYQNFLRNWRKNAIYLQFFGLRDYYFFLKHIFRSISQLSKPNTQELATIINQAIKINFNGQIQSLKIFFQTCQQQNKIIKNQIISLALKRDRQINPVKQCLALAQPSVNSRCIMVIYSHDLIAPFVNRMFSSTKTNKIKMVSLHGSFFKNDLQNQEYNLQKITKISSYLPKKIILALKDFNGAIYTSYYEVFNKNYTKIGNSHTTRISIGQFSNSKCQVHPDFNIMLFVSQKQILNREIDSAAINRFTKIFFDLNQILTQEQQQIVQCIQDWKKKIYKCLRTTSNVQKYTDQFVNSSKQSLSTLILSFRNKQLNKAFKIEKAKRVLIRNRLFQVDLALQFNEIMNKQLSKLKDLVQRENQQIQQFKFKNKIFFTFDSEAQYLNNLSQELSENIQKRESVHLSKILGNNKIIQENISNIKQQGQIIRLLNQFYESSVASLLILKFNMKNLQQKILDHLFYLISERQSQIRKEKLEKKLIRIIIFLDRNQEKQRKVKISYLYPFQQYFKEYPLQLNENYQKFLSKEGQNQVKRIKTIFSDLKHVRLIQHLFRLCEAYFQANQIKDSIKDIITTEKIKYHYLPAALKTFQYKFQCRKHQMTKGIKYIWCQSILKNIYNHKELIQYLTQKTLLLFNEQDYTFNIYKEFVSDNDIQSQSYNTIHALKKFTEKFLLKILISILKGVLEKGIITWLFKQQILRQITLNNFYQRQYTNEIKFRIEQYFKVEYWKQLGVITKKNHFKSIKTQMLSNNITIPQLSVFPFLKDVLMHVTLQDQLCSQIQQSQGSREKCISICLEKQCHRLKKFHNLIIDLRQELQSLNNELQQLQNLQNLQRINQINEQISKLPQQIKDEQSKFIFQVGVIQKTFSQTREMCFLKNNDFFNDKIKYLLLFEIIISLEIRSSVKKQIMAQCIVNLCRQCFLNLDLIDLLMIVLINLEYVQILNQLLIASQIDSQYFYQCVGDNSDTIKNMLNLVPSQSFTRMEKEISNILFNKYLQYEICLNSEQAESYLIKFSQIYYYALRLQNQGNIFQIPIYLQYFNKIMEQSLNISESFSKIFLKEVSKKMNQNKNIWRSLLQSILQLVVDRAQISTSSFLQITACQIFPAWMKQINKKISNNSAHQNSIQINHCFNLLKGYLGNQIFLQYTNQIYNIIFIAKYQQIPLSTFIAQIQNSQLEVFRTQFQMIFNELTQPKTKTAEKVKEKILISIQNYTYFYCKKGKLGDLQQNINSQTFQKLIQELLNTDSLSNFNQNLKWGIIKYYLQLYTQSIKTEDQMELFYVQLIDSALISQKKISSTMRLVVLKILLNQFKNNTQNLYDWIYQKQRGSWTKRQQIKFLFQQQYNHSKILQYGSEDSLLTKIFQLKKKNQYDRDYNSLFEKQIQNTKQLYVLVTFLMIQIYQKRKNKASLKNHKWIQNSLYLKNITEFYLNQTFPSKLFVDKNQKLLIQETDQKVFLNIFNWLVAFSTTKLNNPLANSFLFDQLIQDSTYQQQLDQVFVVGGLQHPSYSQLQNLERKIIFKCSKNCPFYIKVDENMFNQSFRGQNQSFKETCKICNKKIQSLDDLSIIGPNFDLKINQKQNPLEKLSNTLTFWQSLKYYIEQQKHELWSEQIAGHQNQRIKLKGYQKIIAQKQFLSISRLNIFTKKLLRIISQTFYHITYKLNFSYKFSQEESIQNFAELIKRFNSLKKDLIEIKLLNKQQANHWLISISNKIFQAMLSYKQIASKNISKKKKEIQQVISIHRSFQNNAKHQQYQNIRKIIIQDLQNISKNMVNGKMSLPSVRNQCEQIINCIVEQNLSFEVMQRQSKQRALKDRFEVQNKNIEFLKENPNVNLEKYEKSFKNIWATSLIKNISQIEQNSKWLNYFKDQVKNYPILKLIFQRKQILEQIYMVRTILTYLTSILDQIDGNYQRQRIKKMKISELFQNNNYLSSNFKSFSSQWNKCVKNHNQMFWNHIKLEKLKDVDKNTLVLNLVGDDREELKNQVSLGVLKLIIALSEIYNSHYRKLIYCFSLRHNYKQKIQVIDPARVYQNQLIGVKIQKIIERIQRQSSYSVRYGQTIPIYAFGLVNRLIESQFLRVPNILKTNVQQIRRPLLKDENNPGYSIQKIDSLTQLWKSNDQKQLPQSNKKNLKNIILQLMLKDKTKKQFIKEYLKQLINCIQSCIIKYVSVPIKRREKSETKISDFLSKHRELRQLGNRICEFTSENIFQKQEIDRITLAQILSFHDLVQQQLYQFVYNSLSDKYLQKFKDQDDQKQAQQFINKIKLKQFGQQINIKSFYQSLCKMAFFNLTSNDDRLNDKKIIDILLTKEYYWPRKLNNLKDDINQRMNFNTKMVNFGQFLKIVENEMKAIGNNEIDKKVDKKDISKAKSSSPLKRKNNKKDTSQL